MCFCAELFFQAEHFRFAESNKAIANSTIALFLSIAPKLLRPAGRWAVYALMDPALLKAMGLPQVGYYFFLGACFTRRTVEWYPRWYRGA